MSRRKKNKPFMQTTMKDIATTAHGDGSMGQLFTMGELSKDAVKAEKLAQTYWTDHEKDIVEYNKNIYKLDPQYTQLEPGAGIIVRCFHIEAKQKNGIWICPEIPMKEMTQNGIGVRETMNSPWKFMKKAVVVAVPKNLKETFKPGDTVELDRNAITAIKPSVDHPPHLECGFTTSAWYGFEPPKNPKNEHFGYLRLDYNAIVAKYKTKENGTNK